MLKNSFNTKKTLSIIVFWGISVQIFSQVRFPLLVYLKDSIILDSFYIRQMDTFFLLKKEELKKFNTYIVPLVNDDNIDKLGYYNGVIRAENVARILINRYKIHFNNIYIAPQKEDIIYNSEYPLEYIVISLGMVMTDKETRQYRKFFKFTSALVRVPTNQEKDKK